MLAGHFIGWLLDRPAGGFWGLFLLRLLCNYFNYFLIILITCRAIPPLQQFTYPVRWLSYFVATPSL